MPELPEVETIARKLRATIEGKKISEVILSGMSLRRPMAQDFESLLRGRTIVKIHRRGKYLILELEPRAFCLMHLGMSGRVYCHRQTRPPLPHTHAILRFSDAAELHFTDHRRFGLLAAYALRRIELIPELRTLGPDPSGAGCNADRLHALLLKSKQQIKSFLLDQHHIAGLGNIYVCEVLYDARLHPERRCNTLTREEIESLARSIRKIVRAAIHNRGTSFSDFVDSDGQPGDNQQFLRVFQREGERCRRCGDSICRMRQGNRSTFCCPGCQI
jgi:formamidopyrimidine-DNA glycosylase